MVTPKRTFFRFCSKCGRKFQPKGTANFICEKCRPYYNTRRKSDQKIKEKEKIISELNPIRKTRTLLSNITSLSSLNVCLCLQGVLK